jgi:flagellar biosynthesis chaperone FliJ
VRALTLTTALAAVSASVLIHASGTSVSAAETSRVADDVLPIRQIVLYRSGVGFFERRGEVTGDATVSLRFNTEDVNDILKSLLVQDLGGGSIGTVSYTAREPLERRLAGLEIDVLTVTSTSGLLQQLRGAEIEVATMGTTITGKVLVIESRMSVVETDGAVGHFQEPHVVLVTKDGIRAIAVSAISSFELTDERLNDELNRALAVIASSRSENTKVIDLSLSGPDGSGREVRASYVHATPVWKTSYRMVIPDDGGEPYLQGWAIVENTSDADWDNVQLSLASGQPVSFVMDLYEPLRVNRPEVPVPFVAGLAMRVYEGGRAMVEGRLAAAPAPSERARRGAGSGGGGDALEMAATLDQGGQGFAGFAKSNFQNGASGTEVGEQFFYQVDAPVTIARRTSAMLPIISTDLSGERVSIFTPGEGRNPMRGLRFENDSGMPLLPGPISVYDAGAYAGDAQIAHTPGGAERLLAYALDSQMEIDSEQNYSSEVMSFALSASGLVERRTRQTSTTTYALNNIDEKRERTVLIEHPRMGSDWEYIGDVKPVERTDRYDRFEVTVKAGEDAELVLRQQRIDRTTTALTGADLQDLLVYAARGKASDEVVDAVRKAGQFQAQINTLEQRLNELRRDVQSIESDQGRIRSNMGSIDRNSDLYRRYMTRLNEQEDELEQLRNRIEETEQSLLEARRQLSQYLESLSRSNR